MPECLPEITAVLTLETWVAAFVSLFTAKKYSDKNPIYTSNWVISQVHTINTTQTKYPDLWLISLPRIYQRLGPGTCLSIQG